VVISPSAFTVPVIAGLSGFLTLIQSRGRPVTSIIVTKIVGIAAAGEFNPDRISSPVLAELVDAAPTARSR